MRNNEEYKIAKHISTYLKMQYPDIYFRFDMAGLNLSKAQAGMNKSIQHSKGHPDLIIFCPKGKWHGLFLELKKDGTNLLSKSGTKFATEHIQEQAWMHEKLQEAGYYAKFAIGADEAIFLINDYMNLKY